MCACVFVPPHHKPLQLFQIGHKPTSYILELELKICHCFFFPVLKVLLINYSITNTQTHINQHVHIQAAFTVL